jgi:hypothetical protein
MARIIREEPELEQSSPGCTASVGDKSLWVRRLAADKLRQVSFAKIEAQ